MAQVSLSDVTDDPVTAVENEPRDDYASDGYVQAKETNGEKPVIDP